MHKVDTEAVRRERIAIVSDADKAVALSKRADPMEADIDHVNR
jgi:hypothetical protein